MAIFLPPPSLEEKARAKILKLSWQKGALLTQHRFQASWKNFSNTEIQEGRESHAVWSLQLSLQNLRGNPSQLTHLPSSSAIKWSPV